MSTQILVRDPGYAVVTASVRNGSTPLHFRYLAGYVRDLLARPGEVSEGPPASWKMQARVEHLDAMLAREDALEEARGFADLEPDSPVPWYDLAYISANRGDAQSARRYLKEAVKRNPAYSFGYIAISGILSERRMNADALSLLEDGSRAHAGSLDIARALGAFYNREGKYHEAVDLYADLVRRFPGVPDVHADYAAALWMKGDRKLAEGQMSVYMAKAHPGLHREQTIRGWEAMTSESVGPAGEGQAR